MEIAWDVCWFAPSALRVSGVPAGMDAGGEGRMEKRRWIALVIIPLIALTGYGSTAVYNRALSRSLEEGGLGMDFTHWTPTPREVQMQLDGIRGEKERQEKFVPLFKQRFRRHDPPLAIGLRFAPGNRILLMCPARMEPWNMDRLALATWKEAKADFGHSFDIDIFITYIGAAPMKVGELRPMPVDPNFAQIRYGPPPSPRALPDTQYHPWLLFSRPLQIDYRILTGDTGDNGG